MITLTDTERERQRIFITPGDGDDRNADDGIIDWFDSGEAYRMAMCGIGIGGSARFRANYFFEDDYISF